MSGPTHPNGVVLCVIDQLGGPLGGQGLSALPRASTLLERFAAVPLRDAQGRAAGLDQEAAYYAMGTGIDRPDIGATLDKLVETTSLLQAPALEAVVAHAEAQRGTYVDFVTENEKPRCCVHLVAHVSSEPEHNRHLHELAEALTAAELPYVVHAILGDKAGAPAPPKAAQGALEQLEYRFGEVGKFATVMGREYALGAELDWDRAFTAFQAIVRGHEADTAEKIYHALEAAYGAERVDATIEPTRIGGYEGVSGSLRAELTADAPAWEWHGQDVGVVWVPQGDEATRLVSVLLGRGIGPELQEKIAIRGRAMFAFEEAQLASLVPVGSFDIPFLVDSAASSPSLLESLAAGGRKCRKVESADAPAALALAVEGVRSGEYDFQLVALSGLVPGSIDEGLEALTRAVLERGGALIVVANDTLRIAADAAVASVPAVAQHRDVFRLAHELLGVAIHDAAAASRRARRRR